MRAAHSRGRPVQPCTAAHARACACACRSRGDLAATVELRQRAAGWLQASAHLRAELRRLAASGEAPPDSHVRLLLAHVDASLRALPEDASSVRVQLSPAEMNGHEKAEENGDDDGGDDGDDDGGELMGHALAEVHRERAHTLWAPLQQMDSLASRLCDDCGDLAPNLVRSLHACARAAVDADGANDVEGGAGGVVGDAENGLSARFKCSVSRVRRLASAPAWESAGSFACMMGDVAGSMLPSQPTRAYGPPLTMPPHDW